MSWLRSARGPLAHPRRGRTASRRRDERGAVAVVMALVLCFVILPLTGLAVDIGMQRVARRDAQAIADTSAQDAARALGTGTTTQSALQAIAQASALNETSFVGVGAPTVRLYVGTLGTTFTADQSLGCGTSSPYNGYFQATPSGSVPTAVLVTVTNSVRFGFSPGSGSVCRSAIARAYKTACMTIDSYAAQLTSNNSTVLGPLTKILGTSIDTSVLSSSGILTTNLDVLGFLDILKTQLGVGSADQVLTTQVTVSQLLAAEATALTQSGTTGALAASALQSQITSKIGSIVAPAGFTVGSLLGITQGSSSAIGTTVNAFDLAAAAVQLANGTNAVALDIGTPVGLTALTGLTVSAAATLGSAPTRVCLGEGTTSVSQTTATAVAKLDPSSGLVSGAITNLVSGLQGLLTSLLGGDVITVDSVTVTASAALAQASGSVTGVACTGATPTSLTVAESSALAPATVTLSVRLKDVHKGLLGVVLGTYYPTLNVTLSTVPTAVQSTTATLAVPGDYGTGRPGPDGNTSLGSLYVAASSPATTDDATRFTALFGSVANVVTDVNSLLVSPLLSTVVSPLLTTLTSQLKSLVGLTIAGSTYTPLPTPSCGSPALSG